MNITFVVLVLNEEDKIVDAYCRREKLPFAPAIGMKLSVNSRMPLWQTADGMVLDPPIKEIVYNLDDDEVYCLFEVDKELASGYWSKIKNMDSNHELRQFKLHNEIAGRADGEAREPAEARGTHQGMGTTMLLLINLIVPFGLLCYNTIQNIESIF
ncbi:hypothetical protein SAMN02745823_00164 [Sporobacter termitidis DSM 10068]|uniref:Uncharacterized protein n=1 Tax=Sporobacter termitidis DSM 10068 TaxID=1123282 RepID=A0A1M5TNP5_9FIRM|nr:hypothetical protein [Sporobacter termitidis]SHH52308.1 hypothetical protein SAMN02745823_00164 [Sporobacter termitidis DSM 10068]